MESNRQLEERTLVFAVAVVRFVATFPHNESGSVIGRQLLKAGTSIGANYREANRAESRDDFIHKTGIVLKEAAEADLVGIMHALRNGRSDSTCVVESGIRRVAGHLHHN